MIDKKGIHLTPDNEDWVPEPILKELNAMNVTIGQAYATERPSLNILPFYHADGIHGIFYVYRWESLAWYDLIARDNHLEITVSNASIPKPRATRPGTRKVILPGASLAVLFDAIRRECSQMKLVPIEPCHFVVTFQDAYEKDQLWQKQQNEEYWASTFFLIKANDKCQPSDREQLYDDPLDDALCGLGYGYVDGGGTLINLDGHIENCDLVICIHQGQNLEVVRDLVIAELKKLFLPKGSTLVINKGEEQLIGEAEVLAFAFNNALLDTTDDDLKDVITEMNSSIQGEGRFTSQRKTAEETIAYFCGHSYESMKKSITPILAKYKVCQQGRFYQEA